MGWPPDFVYKVLVEPGLVRGVRQVGESEGLDRVFNTVSSGILFIMDFFVCISFELLKYTFLFVRCCFWLRHAACRILVPGGGIEPLAPAVEARSPNHWTARGFPRVFSILITEFFGTPLTFTCRMTA